MSESKLNINHVPSLEEKVDRLGQLPDAAREQLISSEIGRRQEKYLRLQQAFMHEVEVAELEKTAKTDHLTGLPTRASLEDAFHGLQGSRYQRSTDSKAETHSLIMFDLDKFKQANDTQGHAYGDMVLKTVADKLRSAVRNRDVPVRQGGDEFVVLLPRSDVEHAAQAAERIRDNIEKAGLGVTASMGVSEVNLGLSLEENLAMADAAAYAAKEGGRNMVVRYDQLG